MKNLETNKKIIDALVDYNFEKGATLSDFLQEKIFTENIGIHIFSPRCENDVFAYFETKKKTAEESLFYIFEVFTILKELQDLCVISIIPISKTKDSLILCSYDPNLAYHLEPRNNIQGQQCNDSEQKKDNSTRIPFSSIPIKNMLNSTVIKADKLYLLKKNQYKCESIRIGEKSYINMNISLGIAILSLILSVLAFFFN